MKRFVMILSLALALVMTVGCTAANADPKPTKTPLTGVDLSPIDPASLATGLPSGVSLAMAAQYWEQVDLGGSTGGKTSYEVFTDHASFKARFGEYELKRKYSDKSFEDAFIVAVHVFSPTGGWSYELTEGIVNNGNVRIVIEGKKPTGMVTQAFEEHVILIAFDRSMFRDDLSFNISAPEFTKPVDER